MSENKNANEGAFPVSASWRDDEPDIIQVQQEGLTKREYFAGLAMQGYIAAGGNGMPEPPTLAGYAIAAADELLKQLNNSKSQGDVSENT